MSKEMLINVSEGEECRIALLEDGRLEELYMERTSSTSHVGNIYKGRVTNVEPSIQAAFVDFGLGRNGFLHISDLLPSYFGRRGEDIQESVGRKMARRDRPPIQRCLRRGDEIVVQIIKEGIGTKGPTLSTYLSIPGRIIVMMPGMSKLGVSRKIEDEAERKRLRQILDALKPPKDMGFIIRTAGVGKTKLEIQRDLNYLLRLWQNIEKKRQSKPAPVELYTEGDLVTRTVRDVFTSDVDRIIVDSQEVARRVKEFIKIAQPRTKNKVDLYEDPVPIFHKYGIEKEIELMYSRHVPLPSGGSLVIDSTEAIVAIDVNSGKFRDHSDAELTAFKTDLEAADEIPRQLRLRDLGGVIICDFIDLRYERHRRDLEKRLHDNMRKDRAKTKALRMSQFGIIEMTRQRMRPSLKRSIYFDCPHCKGAGLVKTPESMSLDVMRRLAIGIHDDRVQRVELTVCPDVAFYLQNKKRHRLAALENSTKKRIVIHADLTLGLDETRLDLYDSRDGLVVLDELTPAQVSTPHRSQLDDRARQRPGVRRAPAGEPPERGREDRRGRRGRGRDREPAPTEEEYTLDSLEEAIEEREEHLMDELRESSGGLPETRRGPAEEAFEPEQAEPVPAAERGQEEEGQGEGGRRRRRRGRRGRGRGRSEQPAESAEPGEADSADMDQRIPQDAEQVSAEPAARGDRSEPVMADKTEEAVEAANDMLGPAEAAQERSAEQAEESKSDEAAATPRRRRRRGGRRRRGEDVPAGNGAIAAADAAADAEQTQAAEPEASANEPADRPRSDERSGSRSRRVAEKTIRTGSTDRHLIEDEPVAPEPARRPRTYRDLDHIPDDFD
jgi:ribonuclease E